MEGWGASAIPTSMVDILESTIRRLMPSYMAANDNVVLACLLEVEGFDMLNINQFIKKYCEEIKDEDGALHSDITRKMNWRN